MLADGDVLDARAARSPSGGACCTRRGTRRATCACSTRPTGTVVVGDMVASVGTILIAPGDGDMIVYLEQLAGSRGLDARLALPAHGDPIDDPTALFERYVAHRLMREAKVLAAVLARGSAGGADDEILANAYDDVPATTWPIAMLSLRAHLEKLVTEGRVRRQGSRYAGLVSEATPS